MVTTTRKRKYYAGIGNQSTPEDTLNQMSVLALFLNANWAYILRSGGAKGADSAFEKGVVNTNKIILRAKDCTPEAKCLAEKYHPAWHNCNEYVRGLMGRNAMIILGEDLKTPVEFVLCYAADENRGGTALGIKIARAHNIPVFNFAICEVEDFLKWLVEFHNAIWDALVKYLNKEEDK